MSMPLRLLVIEDDEDDATLLISDRSARAASRPTWRRIDNDGRQHVWLPGRRLAGSDHR